MQTYVLEPLGADEGGGNPISAYGARASEWIMASIRRVPRQDRVDALKTLLDKVDPNLYQAVATQATANKARGMRPRAAMKAALAASLSKGMATEIVKAGTAAVQGRAVSTSRLEGLGFCGPICLAKKAGGAISDAASWVGSNVASGTTTAAGWVADGVQQLGSLACSVTNSSIAPIAGAAAASAAGAPPQVGAAGVSVAQGLCGKNNTPTVPTQQLMQPAMPSWVIPAAIGGGVLVIVLAMR